MKYSDLIEAVGQADETSTWRVGNPARFAAAFEMDLSKPMTLMGFKVIADRKLGDSDVRFVRPCGAETAFVLARSPCGDDGLPLGRVESADVARDLTDGRHLVAALNARGIAWSPISYRSMQIPAVLRAGWDCATATAGLPAPQLSERYASWPGSPFPDGVDPEDFA